MTASSARAETREPPVVGGRRPAACRACPVAHSSTVSLVEVSPSTVIAVERALVRVSTSSAAAPAAAAPRR